MTTATPVDDITAVILAGGKARRMDGEDKGLITLHGRNMVEYILTALQPQAGNILINANRNHEQYGAYGLPVVADMLGDYFGPLVGMATGMRAAATPLLMTVPCDSPFIPAHLGETLYRALAGADAEISVAHDGTRLQPVYALLRCELLPDLLDYLDDGGRKIDTWYELHRMVPADFSATPEVFQNLNTPEDKQRIEKTLATGQEIA